MEWPEMPVINVTKVVVSVTGALLTAYHTSRRAMEAVWIFTASNIFVFCADRTITYYIPMHLQLLAYLASAILGGFILREFIAYFDLESASLVRLVVHVIQRRVVGKLRPTPVDPDDTLPEKPRDLAGRTPTD